MAILAGTANPSIDWHVRQDLDYHHPTSMDDFRDKNCSYILEKLKRDDVDEQWESMLNKILGR